MQERERKCGARENERVDSRLARTAVARTFSMTPVRVFVFALDVTEDPVRHLIGQPWQSEHRIDMPSALCRVKNNRESKGHIQYRWWS